MSDLVSVLVPCYNSKLWIRRTLQSILGQTHSKLQIIVVDDGSSDNSRDIITNLKDSRIELHCQKHLGISKTLNYGLTKCKSEYIFRLDSDDIADNSRIKIQLNFMKENPEYDIVGSNYKVIDGNDIEIGNITLPENHEQIVESMYQSCSLWIGSALIKKQLLLDLGGFNETRVTAEDWDFFLKVIDNVKFYNIQKFLTYKRVHSNCISSAEIAKSESKEVLYFYNKQRIINSSDDKTIANSYFNIGYFHYYQTELIAAKTYFTKAIKKDRFNLQYLRYFVSAKLFKAVIPWIRRFKLYKLFSPLKFLDKNNKYFKSQF